MKYHVLYNMIAGHGNSREKAERLNSILEGEICYYDVTSVSYPELVGSIGADDAIVICGGDGTLNRFINAVDGMDFDNDVLYYPIGTGNDFVRDIGADTNAPFSVKKYIKDLPTVTVEGKTYRFLNNVGFGIDGYCCEVGDNLKKTSTKPVNYTSIAIKGLLFHYSSKGATVVVDGKEYRFGRVWLAPTMKGRYYGGGMMASPEQDRLAEDGRLSVMLFHNGGRLATLMAFPSIFKGEHVNKKKMVSVISGYDISVKFDAPATVQIDGETILGVTEYRAYAKAEKAEAPAAEQIASAL